MFGNSIAGTYAEYVVAPAEYCIPLPDDISLEAGAVISDAIATPYHAVKNCARVRAGDIVVVYGCGGFGVNVVQCSVALGAGKVIAVDGSKSRLKMARRLGASQTINSKNCTHPEREIHKLTGGGTSVAFETLGRAGTVQQAFDSVRQGGRVCLVGYTRDEVPIPIGKLMSFDIEVTGSQGCPVREYPRLFDLVRRGMIKVSLIVTRKLPLEKINDAFDLLRRDEGLRTLVLPCGLLKSS
jgi:threonine dehydrogenase-like Zn-dependent dehydrogenase